MWWRQTPHPRSSSTNVTQLGNITVVGKLDQARSTIVPNLGATAYTHTAEQIEDQSQGDNAPFNQVILRSPGVAQDSAVNGDLHVRGEHANLQYRINDVLLPEGITGFGLELDPRFVDSMQLITGSLPAQYGFRTAGVVDIQTKTGAFENGGEFDLYGGSYDTVRPSFEYGGTSGKWTYFVDASFDHNSLGIENPTASHDAIHDVTDQSKAFAYASYIIDDTSRISFMGSASYSNFQVPNSPGLPAGTSPDGNPWLPINFDSSDLNEQQREQNYYGVVTYQKSVGDFNAQVSAYGRASGVHFRPGCDWRPLFQRCGQRRGTGPFFRRFAARCQLPVGRQQHHPRRRANPWMKWFLPIQTQPCSPWTRMATRTGTWNPFQTITG